ncbi:MAG: Zn-ribbon domain-containing OB-fold protein, partial [Iamia sp.]
VGEAGSAGGGANVAEPATTRLEPPESPAGAPFWAATRERRFTLPWCQTCDRPHWFPRDFCPHCLTGDVEWREASGRGVVYAVSVMPKPANPTMAGREPYAVALIELAEGVRMMSEVTGCPPDEVTVDLPVRLRWEALGDGRHLPLFEPDG